MRRPYTAEFYRRLVEKMRQRVPDAAIGADVMVGFPTETEEDFIETKIALEPGADDLSPCIPLFPTTRHSSRLDATDWAEVKSPVSAR